MEIHLNTEEFRALRKKQKQPNLHTRLYKKVTVLIMLHQYLYSEAKHICHYVPEQFG